MTTRKLFIINSQIGHVLLIAIGLMYHNSKKIIFIVKSLSKSKLVSKIWIFHRAE